MNINDQRNKNQRRINKRTDPRKRNESGYALIGLMAVMMFALILTTVAAPTLKQEMQREKEEEMLWRGQQVAYAIKRYRLVRPGMFPTDLNELVQGIDVNGKKIRLLRPSALCDPMTPCTDGTNWRMVHPGDPLPAELLEAIMSTQDKSQMPINPANLQELVRFAQMGAAATNLPGRPADTQLDGVIGPPDNQGGDSGSGSDDKLKKGPIIGVVSRKSDKMFRTYYGIDEYDHALFFPDVPVLAGGFVNPFVAGTVVAAAPAPQDPRCPAGGIFQDGRCFGTPTKICRDPKTDLQIPCPPN